MKHSTQTRLTQWIRIWTIALLSVIGALFAAEVNAAQIGVLGGLNMSSASFDPALPMGAAKSKSGMIYGVSFDFAMSPTWSIETGALYGDNQVRVEFDANNYVDMKQTAINIPVLVRYHFAPAFSLGVGAYYNLNMGNSKSTTTLLGVTGAETDSGSKLDSDYGAAVSARAEIPIASKVKFALEGRYNLGLKGVDTGAGQKATFSSIYGLGGIVFEL